MGPQSSHDVYGWMRIRSAIYNRIAVDFKFQNREKKMWIWIMTTTTTKLRSYIHRRHTKIHKCTRFFFVLFLLLLMLSFTGCKSLHFPPWLNVPHYKIPSLSVVVVVVFIWLKNLWTTFPKIEHISWSLGDARVRLCWWHWFLKLACREIRENNLYWKKNVPKITVVRPVILKFDIFSDHEHFSLLMLLWRVLSVACRSVDVSRIEKLDDKPKMKMKENSSIATICATTFRYNRERERWSGKERQKAERQKGPRRLDYIIIPDNSDKSHQNTDW